MKAVAYIRVSTTEQKLGLEAQDQAIRKWCVENNVELLEEPFVDEGLSGGLELEKRPGLVAALAAVKQHKASYLLIMRRDRLARDREISGTIGLLLRKSGCRIQTTDGKADSTEDPFVTAMEGMQDVFAELERAMIRARTKAALAVKKSKGERVGTVPYGYSLADDGKTLVSDPEEQQILKTVKKLRKKGLSLRQICNYLTDEGHTPRDKTIWYPSTINRMLTR